MAMRFQKRLKIAPGVKLNVSTKGVSTTVGTRGASVNVGKKGTYVNTGIPGTGLSQRTRIAGGKKDAPQVDPTPSKSGGEKVIRWMIILVAIGALIWFL
jgi:hypothetical protein